MKYLCSVQETYRVDTESEVEAILKEAKSNFDLVSYTSKRVETKEDEYFKVTLTKVFNDIKEPVDDVEITYGRNENGEF